MKKIILIIFVSLLFNSFNVNGQSSKESDFINFADKQSNLLHEAYEKRDLKKYNSLLKDFSKKFDSLNNHEKKDYKTYNVIVYYNLCCLYSLLNDKKLALETLEKTIKAGYTNYSHILEDSDLNNIRNEKLFGQIIQPIREVGDYLYILKKDNRFTKSDNIKIPDFTYQSSSDTNLIRLRTQFNLDSVAGTGNENSKFINILHWVHNSIHHDGQHESGIKSINGFEIAMTCKNKNIGVSCGELATVLNDCYLSMGFKSRKIYCQPKDSLFTDYDAHVINMVYSNQLKKWLWMDPTNDAYVMDEKGNLLGIEEVRVRLINNKPMIVNPDANWNHKTSTVKENYLYYYMTKNLYRFFCPLESKFDVETKGLEKTIIYVNFFPSGYGKFKQYSAKEVFYNKAAKTNFINYFTNNPSTFWKAPNL